MSFLNFSFEYDPHNPEQQNDISPLNDMFGDVFSDHGLGLQHLLYPQDAQIESQDINGLELGVIQNMLNYDIPSQEQAQDSQPALPDLIQQQGESFSVQEQHIPSDLSFRDRLQVETSREEISWQHVPQLESHAQDVIDAHPQLESSQAVSQQVKSRIQQQQKLQSEHLANENELWRGTQQAQMSVHELGSHLEEAKEQLQQKESNTSTLRLRMRLQPNERSQQQMEASPRAHFQLGDLRPQPRHPPPIQVQAPSHPLTDIFGHSQSQILSHVPRRSERSDLPVQVEHAPEKENSILNLPFWKVENPSNVPSYHYLLGEAANTSDPLGVANANLFASEITGGAAEVGPGASKGARKANRKGKTNSIVSAIERPSEFTQTKLLSNAGTGDMLVHEMPIFPSNGAKEQKTGGRKLQTNEHEPRRQLRVARSRCSTNSDSEEDEEDRSDPSYIPGEAREHSEEPTDHFFDSDPPRTVKHQILKKPAIEVTFSDPFIDSIREEMCSSKFQFDHVTCPKCNDVFANSDSLDRHFRLVHSEPKGKVHICKECQQTCRNEQNLRRHWSNVHSGELKFICDECGARFSTKRSLSLHRPKQHPDVYKPTPKRKKKKFHECQMCDYTSDQSYNVIRHFFTRHTDNVAMECLYGCGKTFKSVSNAKVHFAKCKRRPLKNE